MRLGYYKTAAAGARLLLPAAVSCLLVGAQEPVFRSSVNLVVIDVAVASNSGQPVAGLMPSNFEIKENKEIREIEQFGLGTSELSMALVVDFSSSMRPRQATLTESVTSLLPLLNPSDEVLLMAFNDRPEIVVPLTRPDQGTAADWKARLSRARPAGRTALYDAIIAGGRALESAGHERKVVVVLSDGADNASTATLRDVSHLLQAANYLVYGIGLFKPGEPDTNAGTLREIASATGGLALFEKDPARLSPLLERVMQDLRSRYVLAFRSPSPTGDQAEIRKLEVTARDDRGRKLKVRARGEYRANGSSDVSSPTGTFKNTGQGPQSNP